MNDNTIAETFLNHARNTAREKFGHENAQALPCHDGVGSLLIHTSRECEYLVVVNMLGPDKMWLTMNKFYAFTPGMFERFAEEIKLGTTIERPFGLQTELFDRDFQTVELQGLDPDHLQEQAEYIIEALHASASPTL